MIDITNPRVEDTFRDLSERMSDCATECMGAGWNQQRLDAGGIANLLNEAASAVDLAGEMLAALQECRDLMHADNPADGWKDAIDRADAVLAKVTPDPTHE